MVAFELRIPLQNVLVKFASEPKRSLFHQFQVTNSHATSLAQVPFSPGQWGRGEAARPPELDPSSSFQKLLGVPEISGLPATSKQGPAAECPQALEDNR